MESKLKYELDKFWEWVEITPQEYAKGKVSSKCEDDYPNWSKLHIALEEEIKFYNDNLNNVSANFILETLAIDNESESVKDKLISELNEKAQSHLSFLGLEFYMSNARWQIADFLREVEVSNKKDLLKRMVNEDRDKYVQRRALLTLSSIDPLAAEEYAYQKINDDDEYLKLVSLRILKKRKSKFLYRAVSILQRDPSQLIQNELREI